MVPPDLHRLQDELLALKAKYPELKLKKSTPPSPTAPFPIIVSKVIEAPPQASYIDIDSLTLKATITLASNEPSKSSTSSVAEAAASVLLEIVSSDLPGPLKHAIAHELQNIRDAAPDDGGLLKIEPVFAAITADFARLVCLLPEWTERYETVDSEGRTLRRVAILSDEASVSIESSTQKAPKKAQQAQREGLPKGLQAELEALKKRYKVTKVETSGVGIAAATAAMQQLELQSKQGSAAAGSGTVHGHLFLQFLVELHPTDPQWTPSGSALLLECSILDPTSYPSHGSFRVTLQQGVCAAASPTTTVSTLSDQEAAVFNKLLKIEAVGAAGHPDALRAVLRRCENNAGDMLHQAADMAMEIQRRRAAAAAAATEGNKNNNANRASSRGRPSFEKERTSLVGDANSTSDSAEESATESDDSYHWDDAEYSHSEEEDEHSRGEEHALLEQHPGGNSSGSRPSEERLVHNTLRLTLEDLQMVEIDTLDALKVRLQVACTRCKATGEASVLQDGSTGGTSKGRKNLEWAGECSTCHAQWSVTVAPRIVHEGSNVLAVVRAEGCGFLDLLLSMVSAQCSACSNLAAFREVQVGKWNERNCSHCHRRMAFIIPSVAFLPSRTGKEESATGGDAGSAAKRSTAGASDTGGSKARSDRDFVITPGHSLPSNGACKHYRHSYRWLRFPCCGRRYACDLCHEEGADHEMKWAVRMVCGFCSTEQPLGETCKSCGKKLATTAARPSGRNTAFWEGGEGQRDQKRLSKRDPHKYRNSKFKTQSRKSQRVGQKGKEKTERASGTK